MGATSHTPGPWRAIKAPHGPIDIFDARDRDVVTVYGGGVGQGDREANAQLIAAAPEMLAALNEGRRAIGDHFAPSDCYATGPLTGDPYRDLVECPACSFIAMYDAAIAKAGA